MPRSSLLMGVGDTPPPGGPVLPMASAGRWVHSLIGEKNVPEARCLSRLLGGLWPWVGGWARLGVGTLQGSGRSVRDCLALKKLKLSRHESPFSRHRKGGL